MRGAFPIVTREPRPRMGFAGSGCAGCRWQFRGCSVSSLLLIGVLLGSSYPFFVHAATDTLSWKESLALNNTLQSSDGQFILGFFPLGSSPKRYYLGVWFNTTTLAVVWVANRERPLNDTAGGTLTILKNGTLAVLDAAGTLYWSSSSTQSLSSNSTAKLGTDGSFVLSSADGSKLWSSFDHPTDTFIPKLVLTADPSNNQSTRLVSWKGKEDPAPGNYSLGLDPKGSPQLYIWNGEKVRWRSGQWNKVSFIGLTRMRPLSVFGFNLVAGDNNSLSLSFSPPDKTPLRFVMTWDGIERTTSWNNSTGAWDVIWEQPLTPCETYNYCGDNAICSNNSTCECLRGFQPRSEVEWGRNWTGGCVRRSPLACQSNSTNSNSSDGVAGDWFATIDDVKLPNFAETALRLSQSDCAVLCSGNCSCIGYAYVSNIGCMVWAEDLVDIARIDNNSNSQTLFLKLSPNEFTESATSDDKNKIRILWAVLPTVFVVAILCVFLCIGWRYKTRIIEWWRNGEEVETTADPASGRTVTDFSGSREQLVDGEQTGAKASDLPMFSFEVIAAATDNFSDSNKLGQGGFGLVYRGVLPGGDEVAVKRLSGNSGQGIDEFKNEVTLIAKMQHRNLVRLLGCCIQGEEKLLLYEYMPNKSLDSFLFDPTRQPMLDWRKRFDIIEGIARGLLYLHRDSRLRVVHRDLKPSNILLDEEMNPKISDFGMARIFGGNQNSDSTNRVVGTFGYMSPEYAMEGLFSIKSDVYSFGVLILEIVSGKKNSRTRAENYLNLLAYVWQLWTTDRVEEIIDPCIRDSCSRQQVLRCIHIGLLCAQDRAFDRPTMSAVVIMLGTDAPIHQVPKQPTFAAEGSPSDTGSHTQSHREDGEGYSVNDVTITVLSGR